MHLNHCTLHRRVRSTTGKGGANGSLRLELSTSTGTMRTSGVFVTNWRTAINARLAATSAVPAGTQISYAGAGQVWVR